MAVTATQYRDQLAALMPPGAAWPRDTDSQLMALLEALGEELARVSGRTDDLVRESDPRKASELLADWERAFGLPEECVADQSQTTQARRDALVSKMTTTGGQSRQYFINICKALGYTVTITEFRPFTAGSLAGDAISNDDWIFTWRVNAPANTIRPFSAGRSAAGEPLRDWGNDLLECVVERYAPAHTHVLFGYGG